MKRFLLLAAVFAIGALIMPRTAYAHGGSFRGPNGGVPPGLREPSDPEPPPPPPSDPGSPGGPTTPSDPTAPGPTTPSDPGYSTPSEGNAPTPTGPTQGPKKKATTKSLTWESWRYWWGYNNDDILNLKESIYAARVSSSSPLFFSGKKDEENRRNAQRPTQAAITNTIIPALERRLEDPTDNEDVHGGAVVALGKVGTVKYVPMFHDVLRNQWKNSKNTKLELGQQATESGALALGLLPEVDEKGKEAIRQFCLEAIADENLRTRERAWAAISLGFQKDKQATLPLWKFLEKKFTDDNLPAAILCAIGLIGDSGAVVATSKDGSNVTVTQALSAAFVDRQLNGQELSDKVLPYVGYALTKIEDPAALPALLEVLKSRSYGQPQKRSAAIAAGVIGAKADAETKDKVVKALQAYVRKSGGDGAGENFSIIALGQIGTPDAIKTLLELAESGQSDQRPFAALSLATHVFYKERAAARKEGEPVDAKVRQEIVDKLRTCTEKFKDADTISAFYLARGILRDQSAIDPMVEIVADIGKDPLLRGFCSQALGLVGVASEKVKEALKLALKDRKNADLRSDAATGLGLLRDAEVIKVLLDELKNAKSFAVQSQLIRAIGTIGDHTAIAPLVDILDNTKEGPGVRAMAAVGLGMIGDLQVISKLAWFSKNYNYASSLKDIHELLFIL